MRGKRDGKKIHVEQRRMTCALSCTLPFPPFFPKKGRIGTILVCKQSSVAQPVYIKIHPVMMMMVALGAVVMVDSYCTRQPYHQSYVRDQSAPSIRPRLINMSFLCDRICLVGVHSREMRCVRRPATWWVKRTRYTHVSSSSAALSN